MQISPVFFTNAKKQLLRHPFATFSKVALCLGLFLSFLAVAISVPMFLADNEGAWAFFYIGCSFHMHQQSERQKVGNLPKHGA
jgi:hypothetical protein